jgi:hypothetical protein
MSRFPVVFRPAGIRFLGILFPPRVWALLTVGLPDRLNGFRTLTGFPRFPYSRHGRGGRPLYPEASGVHATDKKNPRSPLAVLPRPGPIPRFSSHRPRLTITRHQQGFNFVHPSGLPLARAPRMERDALRLLP